MDLSKLISIATCGSRILGENAAVIHTAGVGPTLADRMKRVAREVAECTANARTLIVDLLLCESLQAVAQQQIVDPDFQPTVAEPAYRSGGPTVAIDEATTIFTRWAASMRRLPHCFEPTDMRLLLPSRHQEKA
jgi:hypothetical protein